MGTQLAELHRATSEQFGWRRANFIGATPQMNEPSKDWPTFYRRCRLQPQLEMVRAKGFGELATRVEAVVGRLGRILGHEPQPALQHGDLWGGNWAADESGQPVIFDSAIHYGDRETDLAMTRLFGGFGEAFYAAYEHAWPLPDGWQQRVAVYQLYHVLNHVNLFGGGYLGQATALLDRLEATP
jgi:fructosamine-3-kinase